MKRIVLVIALCLHPLGCLPRERACETSSTALARNYPLSSPRRRGPIATELSISRRPHHIATTRPMGPRLRGDDSGRFIASHISFVGATETAGSITSAPQHHQRIERDRALTIWQRNQRIDVDA